MRKVPALKMLWRSLWLQASWSFEGMQSLGFAHALEPALDPGDEAARRRHSEFFNTHPFLACALLGCAARLEGEGKGEEAAQVKTLFMGPFGGLGDSFFWGGCKLFLSLAAVLLAFRGVSWAPWAMVGAWLSLSLSARALFFSLGYRGGPEALLGLTRRKFLVWGQWLKVGAAFLAGLWLWANVATGLPRAWGVDPAMLTMGSMAGALGVAWAIRREADPLWIIYGCAAAAFGFGAML